jgi:hypothetical protein
MTKKCRPLSSPRSACKSSKGRVASLWWRMVSLGWDASRLLHESQAAAALAMSTSIPGQNTDKRALWRILLAPWCIPSRTWIVWRTMERGITTRGPITIFPSSSSMASWWRAFQNGRSCSGKLHLSFRNPAMIVSRRDVMAGSASAANWIAFRFRSGDWLGDPAMSPINASFARKVLGPSASSSASDARSTGALERPLLRR